jgi:hypothetical protein
MYNLHKVRGYANYRTLHVYIYITEGGQKKVARHKKMVYPVLLPP